MEVLVDSLLDTLKVFPFLLVCYILIELLEHGTSFTRNKKILQGRLAPLLGSATGLVPQCGFSVLAAKLYDNGLIRTGTVMAVFIATSDEALLILLPQIAVNPRAAAAVVPLLAIKLAIAVAAGYAVNAILRKEKLNDVDENQQIAQCVCQEDHEGKSAAYTYFLSPLLHSLKIALYLLAVNLAFGYIIEAVGEENISALLNGAYWQPFLTAAIGLIPNCASSVIITGAYVNQGIMFGSMVAGLCSNAGLGLVVLLKNTKKWKRNLLIILALYLIAVAAGLAVNAVLTFI